MTKLRAPDSTEDAVRQAIGLLGKERVAAVVERTEQLVTAWSDPDDQRNISVDAALRVDRALQDDGFPPIFAEFMAARCLQPSHAMAAAAPEPPLRAAVRVMNEAACVLKEVEQADCDGVLDKGEQLRILELLTALQRQAGRCRRVVQQRPVLVFHVERPAAARPSPPKKKR